MVSPESVSISSPSKKSGGRTSCLPAGGSGPPDGSVAAGMTDWKVGPTWPRGKVQLRPSACRGSE